MSAHRPIPPLHPDQLHEILGRCPEFIDRWAQEACPDDIDPMVWWRSFGLKIRFAVALVYAMGRIRQLEADLAALQPVFVAPPARGEPRGESRGGVMKGLRERVERYGVAEFERGKQWTFTGSRPPYNPDLLNDVLEYADSVDMVMDHYRQNAARYSYLVSYIQQRGGNGLWHDLGFDLGYSSIHAAIDAALAKREGS